MSKKTEEVRDVFGYKVGYIKKYKNSNGRVFYTAVNDDGEVHFHTEKAARTYLLDANEANYHDMTISAFLLSDLA